MGLGPVASLFGRGRACQEVGCASRVPSSVAARGSHGYCSPGYGAIGSAGQEIAERKTINVIVFI